MSYQSNKEYLSKSVLKLTKPTTGWPFYILQTKYYILKGQILYSKKALKYRHSLKFIYLKILKKVRIVYKVLLDSFKVGGLLFTFIFYAFYCICYY